VVWGTQERNTMENKVHKLLAHFEATYGSLPYYTVLYYLIIVFSRVYKLK